MSKLVREFVIAMRALSIIYLLVGLLFFFFPDAVLSMINRLAGITGMFELVPSSNERFWLALTVSMMMMLSLCAILSARKPAEVGFTHIHLLSKTVSTAAFIILFFIHRPYFAYALGAAVDGTLALLVLWLFRRMQREAA